jgi:4-hydroxy-3-methylbut-2-enyl diphosphate reductase IspH
MVKQLKNRYYDPTLNKRFVVGIDRAKMRLYNVEQEAQNNIMDSGQVVLNQETVKALTQSKGKFNDFTF